MVFGLINIVGCQGGAVCYADGISGCYFQRLSFYYCNPYIDTSSYATAALAEEACYTTETNVCYGYARINSNYYLCPQQGTQTFNLDAIYRKRGEFLLFFFVFFNVRLMSAHQFTQFFCNPNKSQIKCAILLPRVHQL